MALNYTNIFSDAGKYIKASDHVRDAAIDAVSAHPSLGDLLDEIRTQLISSGATNILEGTETLFNGFRNTFSSIAGTLASQAASRLIDRNTVVNELGGTPNDSDESAILRELARQMLREGPPQTINQSVITIGSPTAQAGNVGTGTLLTTKVLDGVSSPASFALPQDYYRGVNSELAVPSESMSVSCVSDSGSGGLTAGSEQFVIEGQPTLSGNFDWRTEGSGENVALSTVNASSIVQNKDFETATSDVFASWTITSGAATVEIKQETVAAQVFRGTAALSLTGTGTDAAMRQAVSPSLITASRGYFLSAAIKGDAAANGTLTIQFVSDSGGYVAAASEKIELNAAALQAIAAYEIKQAVWIVGDSLPDDLEIEIKYAGGSAGVIRVDSLAFAPITYANGVGFGVAAGATDFVLNDRFTVQVDNVEGVFQRFFRRQYAIQFPSSGTPTLLDSLAT